VCLANLEHQYYLVNPANLVGQLGQVRLSYLDFLVYLAGLLHQLLRLLQDFLAYPAFPVGQLPLLEQAQLIANLECLDFPVALLRQLLQLGLKNLEFLVCLELLLLIANLDYLANPECLDFPVALLRQLVLVRCFVNPEFPDCLVRQLRLNYPANLVSLVNQYPQ